MAAIVQAALEIDKKITQGVKATVQTAGKIAAGIASPDDDPAKKIDAFGEALSSTGEQVPIFGRYLVAAGEAARAFASVMTALDATADKYAEYNPQIAQAQAMVEIQQEMANFRRAQEVSAELTRYVQAQGQLQQNFEEIKIKLLTMLLPTVNMMMSTLNNVVTLLGGVAATMNQQDENIDPTSLILGLSNQAAGDNINPNDLMLQPGQLPAAGPIGF